VLSAKGATFIVSLGQPPGSMNKRETPALKARFSRTTLNPRLALVELKPMSAQQFSVLLLERAGVMVLVLRLDVGQHRIQLTLAH